MSAANEVDIEPNNRILPVPELDDTIRAIYRITNDAFFFLYFLTTNKEIKKTTAPHFFTI